MSDRPIGAPAAIVAVLLVSAACTPVAPSPGIESGAAPGEARDWPWTGIAPEDFVEQPRIGFRSRTLSKPEAIVLGDARGGLFGVSVTGPDRAPDTIVLRPLSPDEER
jgi:hypothetical protein